MNPSVESIPGTVAESLLEAKSDKVKASTPSAWPEDPAWSLERLWAEGAKDTRWIVKPLIAEGHQVLLAGEPKAGKSLLASQLCLEIAKGPGSGPARFLKISLPGVSDIVEENGGNLPPGAFEIVEKISSDPHPSTAPDSGPDNAHKNPGKGKRKIRTTKASSKWKVLYVSFEMEPEVMWARTSQQAGGVNTKLLLDKASPEPKEFPGLAKKPPLDYKPGTFLSAHGFYHIFKLGEGRDLGLIPRNSLNKYSPELLKEAKGFQNKLKEVLEDLDVDLVIFDSLSKLHWADENSNLDMRDVLQDLRKLCTIPPKPQDERHAYRPQKTIAHIIIHHTRKESGDQRFMRKGASEMRGASAIHAEADLAITITKRKSNGDEISLAFSSRHSTGLRDLHLVRHGLNGTYSGQLATSGSNRLSVAGNLFPVFNKRSKLTVTKVMALYGTINKGANRREPALSVSWWDKLLGDLAKPRIIFFKDKGVKKSPNTYRIKPSATVKQWKGLVAEALKAEAGKILGKSEGPPR